MGQAIGAALAAGGTILFAALIRRYSSFGVAASFALGLFCTVMSMALLLLAFSVYESRQRGIDQAANAKRICLARVELNADLVARGKLPMYPNLALADCK